MFDIETKRKQQNIERNKKLIEEYPFLMPRNVFTDEVSPTYDYSYILGLDDLPKGWGKLFLQMCEDLKKQLIKDNYLEQFRFLQIKEKYNRMECYNNGCSEEAYRILDKYTHMARYVCTCCGKPAYWETQSYIASYCEQCWKDWGRHEPSEVIKPTFQYRIIRDVGDKKEYKTISFLREWNRYIKEQVGEKEND